MKTRQQYYISFRVFNDRVDGSRIFSYGAGRPKVAGQGPFTSNGRDYKVGQRSMLWAERRIVCSECLGRMRQNLTMTSVQIGALCKLKGNILYATNLRLAFGHEEAAATLLPCLAAAPQDDAVHQCSSL